MYKIKEKDLLIGLILGDGSLYKSGDTYSIYIGHGESQKDYLEWKLSLLKDLKIFDENVLKLKSKKINYNLKEFIQFYFKMTNKKLCEIYNIVYDTNGNKSALQSLKCMKSDRSLAIWFMDDGSVFKRKRFHKDGGIYYLKPSLKLCTHCFTLDQNEEILDWFKRKYRVEGKIAREFKNNKNYYYVRFDAVNTEKIYRLIKQYILEIPSMVKKFNYLISYYE